MQQSESPKSPPEGDREPSEFHESAEQKRSWMRFAGLGMELAGYTVFLGGVGFLFDKHRGHATPYATALGALIGFTWGMYRFIRQASEGSDG